MLSNDRHVRAADGTRVAYRREGSGPALVLCNGITTSNDFWTYLQPRWARRFTVINWDLKGHGESEPARSPEGAHISALARDALRILDAEQIHDAVFVGFSMGCQICLEAYRAAPARVRALGLLLGPGGRLFDTALGPVGPALHGLIRRLPDRGFDLAFRGLQRVVGLPVGYRLGRLLRLIGPAAARDDVQRFIDHFTDRVDPRTLAAMTLGAQAHDAGDLLPRIGVPTLIVAGERDVFAPARRVGERLHRAIPRSELVRLSAGTHTSLFEHHGEIGGALERFCDRHLSPGQAR